MNQLFCPDSTPNFLGLFDTTVAPTLFYYSYLPIILVSIFFGLFIYWNNKKSREAKGLFLVAITFSAFLVNEIVSWVAVPADVVYFSWQLSALLLPVIFGAVFYLVYVYSHKNSLPFGYKLLSMLLYLPIIVLLPTQFNISAFDLGECEALNGILWNYIYLIEIIFVVLIGFISLNQFRQVKDPSLKKQITFLGLASVIFLSIFGTTYVIGDTTFVYEFNLIGPLGMVVFICLIFYMIVRFRAFNVKLLATQAFTIGIWILVFGILFIRRIENVRVVVVTTLVLLFGLGLQLIKSVKREVEQREHIEKLAVDLQIANEGKTNLIHIMNHQIKGYLAKSRNIFADLLEEPEYGITERTKPMIREGLNSLTEGVGFVEQVLNGSSAESGAINYVMRPVDFGEIVKEMVGRQEQVALNKGLQYELKIEDGEFRTTGDSVQLKQAVRNLIDNAVNYTPSGGIYMHLKRDGKNIKFDVKDTGVGISSEDKPRLFTIGGRGKDSLKLNVNSTGYGLSFVKAVVEAHKGRVGADSAGPGKGSTFWMELPVA